MRPIPHVLQRAVVLGVKVSTLQDGVQLAVVAALEGSVGLGPHDRLARLLLRVQLRARQKVLQPLDVAPLLQRVANAVDLLRRELDRRERGQRQVIVAVVLVLMMWVVVVVVVV